MASMSDLATSMVEALGVQDHSLWRERVQVFKEWQHKNSKSSKSFKEAWRWEGSSSDKWSTTSTRGSSKRGQSVPVDLSKRTNPEEKGLAWRELDVLDTSLEFLFPETSLPCPVDKSIHLPSEQQEMYIHWILRSFSLDRKLDKDPRIYCAYCDMNNHPRFACKLLRSTGIHMSDIIVLYVQLSILHSFVPELKSMEVQVSQTGTSKSTSEQSRRIHQLTIDGEI